MKNTFRFDAPRFASEKKKLPAEPAEDWLEKAGKDFRQIILGESLKDLLPMLAVPLLSLLTIKKAISDKKATTAKPE
jgi:hypothetical protein